jgi:hypothetical protein
MTSAAIIMTGSSVWTMKDGTPHSTGFWAEEFIKPYRTFTAAGLNVTLSTPHGRTPTVDPLSLNLAYNHNDEAEVASQKQYLEDLRGRLDSTTPIADLDASGFISIGASNPASRLFRAKARERIVALAAVGDLTVPLARTFAFEDAREGRGYAGSPAPVRPRCRGGRWRR